MKRNEALENNQDEWPWKQHAMWKNLVTKDHMDLWYYLYKTFKIDKPVETWSKLSPRSLWRWHYYWARVILMFYNCAVELVVHLCVCIKNCWVRQLWEMSFLATSVLLGLSIDLWHGRGRHAPEMEAEELSGNHVFPCLFTASIPVSVAILYMILLNNQWRNCRKRPAS
jgi:hypothetical protein